MTNADKTLHDLFEHGIKDLYYAEKKIYKSLPKVIRAAHDKALISGLEKHRDETAQHIERLEEVFELIGKRPQSVRCDAIDGILNETDELVEDFGKAPAGDAAIIFACQAVEHYEITRYGSLVEYAKALGLTQAAGLLKSTLDEEKKADASLTQVAESRVNEAAEHAHSMMAPGKSAKGGKADHDKKPGKAAA